MDSDIQQTAYHSLLRVGVAVLALVLIFDSGLLFKSTAHVSKQTQNYLASAVGVQVGVAPNEVNVLTSRITELEQEVVRKDREIAVNLNTGGVTGGVNTSTIVLSAILFIMLVLIVLNYALDYLRTLAPRPVTVTDKQRTA